MNIFCFSSFLFCIYSSKVTLSYIINLPSIEEKSRVVLVLYDWTVGMFGIVNFLFAKLSEVKKLRT